MVKDFVSKSGVPTQIHNVDLGFGRPPIDVFVYPVLFIDNRLIAYGEDIIRYYKENLMNG